MESVQDVLIDIENAQFSYATFGQRFLASIIDTLVLLPFAFLDVFNKTSWHNILLLSLVFMVTICYKPFMEFKYGATLGKMALKIAVVNTAFKKPELQNAIFRSIFEILSRMATLIISIITFVQPVVEGGPISRVFTPRGSLAQNWVTWTLVIVTFIDLIVFFNNSNKQALHDQIGKTYVVVK